MRPGTGIVLLAVSVFLISFFLCTPTLPALDSVPAATSDEEVHEDKIIKAIEVRGLTHIDDEELIDLIFFGVGDRLSRDELS